MDKYLAKRIFEEAARKHTEINVSQLAREIKVPASTLHHHMRSNRRWRIEEWLATLMKLGAVEVGKQGAYIKSRELVKALKSI